MSLDPSEMAYHDRLMRESAWAREAEARIAAVRAAVESWSAHVAEKYGLGEGDRVGEDGVIVRRR